MKLSYIGIMLCVAGLAACTGKTGPQGIKGDKGDPGIPGTSCIAQIVSGGLNILCGDAPPVFLANGLDGVDGNDGSPGLDGLPGIPGTSCTVTTLLPTHDNPTGGAQITCGSATAIVVNGAAGGAAAAYTVVASVDPCGPSGGQDEVFLRMASGALVALFVDNSSALTARLSYINDGVNYHTTDSQNCTFSLSTTAPVTVGAVGLRNITSTSPIALVESWDTY